MSRDLLPDRVVAHARDRGSQPAIYRSVGGVWTPITWAAYHEQARAFAGALIGAGCEAGGAVAIMAGNHAEWLIGAVGAWFARCVPTGVYPTLTPEQAAYVVHHCEAKVAVVEGPEGYARLLEEKENLPHLRRIVLMTGSVEDPSVVSFAAFLAEGQAHQAEVDARLAALAPDDLADLIYTSGTTGPPKGVMLDHRALAFVARGAISLMPDVSPGDRAVSYLPLSHIAEQAFSLLGACAAGYSVWMCTRLEDLKAVLLVAHPTVFLAVPRVWEKFKAALEARLATATGVKGAIAKWAMQVGAETGTEVVERGDPGGLPGLKLKLARRLFQQKLAGALGLDQLRLAVSGAAPIGKDVLEFFLACGVIIHEVYGQSEDAGPTTFNQPFPGKRRLGTVGLPFPGVEVKIAEDGEILVRGPNVFRGYFKNPEATAETLVDGWLHSGDIGAFDADGFLRITDRKKDLIITAAGKNVAPQNIEKHLRGIAGIGQAVVIGDRRKYLTALMTVDPEGGPALAKERGWPVEPAALAAHPAFRAHVTAEVERVNGELARYETIKHFHLLPRDFTVEGGELTPTQKVKRRVVSERYAAEIEALYPES
ncbi:MAG: long-chain fatty acid--CoA ligase [bacterium]